jgi:tetratricopeptide (TPR) repeat protein
MLESIRNNPEAAATAASTALDHGSKDAWMHILVAQNLWKQQSDRGTLASAAREIADHYAKALELQPNLRNAYSNYARIAQSLPSVTQADASLLSAGFKIYPDAADLLLGIAVVLHKGKNDAQAAQLLGLALSRSSDLSQEDISYAERLRSEWRIEPLARKIEELSKNKLYADALAECEKLLQEPMQMNQQRLWERRRNDLRFQVALDEIQLSENSGNLEEAIRQLEALIARTDLAQGQLSFARRQLERIRKRLPTAEATP